SESARIPPPRRAIRPWPRTIAARHPSQTPHSIARSRVFMSRWIARSGAARRPARGSVFAHEIPDPLGAIGRAADDMIFVGGDHLAEDLRGVGLPAHRHAVELRDHVAVLETELLEQAAGSDRAHLEADHLAVALELRHELSLAEQPG